MKPELHLGHPPGGFGGETLRSRAGAAEDAASSSQGSAEDAAFILKKRLQGDHRPPATAMAGSPRRSNALREMPTSWKEGGS